MRTPTTAPSPSADQAAADAARSLALADEAFARFDVDAFVAHLSAAIRAFTTAGAPRDAAMACVRLGDALANAMGNLVAARAWFARATRLVEHEPPCVEQGWVAVASMGCDVDDPAELLARAELALERARRFGDVDLETKALADAGLAHVQAGRIVEGMALLDEAMALACGSPDDVDTAAKSVCSFFTACYHAADFERAESWAQVMRGQGLIGPRPPGPVFLSSHCASVQAALLFELGRWAEAEGVLVAARTEFERVMGIPAWHPEISLADLRIHQGRHADAEALLLGKDHYPQALLPAARLHLARGDLDLARAAASRGLRALGDDRLRAVELLSVLVDTELAAGDTDRADSACADLASRLGDLPVTALRARAAASRARCLAAGDEVARAVTLLADEVDRTDVAHGPWRRALLLLELVRLHERSGDAAAAAVAAESASALLAPLDVVVDPSDRELLARYERGAPRSATTAPDHTARLARDGRWWIASHRGTSARVADTKGLRYLAELVARPGTEQHCLDLVDRIEGVAPAGGVDRRALGDAGAVLDRDARAAYRRRVEVLRSEADEALARGDLDAAEACQGEIEALVAQLAAAFGLGGRDRRAASAADRARLNVTRAVRAALRRLAEALPEAGAALDRQVRTGRYCAYMPVAGEEVGWIVQSPVNDVRPG